MTERLPAIRPTNAVRALERAGFTVSRMSGSHCRLVHADGRKLTIPIHNADLPRGTLRAIVRQAGLTVVEFTALLKR